MQKLQGNEPSNCILNSLEKFITGTMLWYISNRAPMCISSCLLSYSFLQQICTISLVSVAPVLTKRCRCSGFYSSILKMAHKHFWLCLIHQIANSENPWDEIAPCEASCWRQRTVKGGETSFIIETIGVTSLKILHLLLKYCFYSSIKCKPPTALWANLFQIHMASSAVFSCRVGF